MLGQGEERSRAAAVCSDFPSAWQCGWVRCMYLPSASCYPWKPGASFLRVSHPGLAHSRELLGEDVPCCWDQGGSPRPHLESLSDPVSLSTCPASASQAFWLPFCPWHHVPVMWLSGCVAGFSESECSSSGLYCPSPVLAWRGRHTVASTWTLSYVFREEVQSRTLLTAVTKQALARWNPFPPLLFTQNC